MSKVTDIIKKYTLTAPVDVERIASELGLDIVFSALGDKISGKIQKVDADQYLIVVNDDESPVRQRFTIAHEIGHFLYHRDLIGDGVADSPAYRSPDEKIYETTPLERRHETQANQFAANILMPHDLIRHIEARHPGITYPELAKKLDVSLPALRVRKGLSPYPDALEEFNVVE
ncbi:ImmA/IrrE family metallo-endopeptidase [Mesorhizobium erdmanii]|uniref:ImmA/IrrE family metallo-endopeptidase n=1 Tax=Mesorhizobium erdmanii TaxID=1777866 RepID=UPI0006875912|nr:ImmA/IrrE family metallo-endopeptidase [Mesorhizobium erdmanii]